MAAQGDGTPRHRARRDDAAAPRVRGNETSRLVGDPRGRLTPSRGFALDAGAPGHRPELPRAEPWAEGAVGRSHHVCYRSRECVGAVRDDAERSPDTTRSPSSSEPDGRLAKPRRSPDAAIAFSPAGPSNVSPAAPGVPRAGNESRSIPSKARPRSARSARLLSRVRGAN